MRTARVATNETCNQRCGFCDARRPVERAVLAAAERVRERITAAVAAGDETIVLTGGEPTLRRDLAGLVAHARAVGARQVVLETNAALVDAARARSLRAAGLDLARVHLPAWGDACDTITRDAGAFARTRLGIAALDEAGVAIEVAAPVVRSTAAGLPSLALELARLEGAPGSPVRLRALVLSVPVSAPDERELLPLDEAARAIAAVAEAARRAGLTVRLEPGRSIPPCLFPEPHRVAHLFALSPGGAQEGTAERAAACASCVVGDRCPGVPRAALARDARLPAMLRPLVEDRVRRRLSVISTVEDQVTRELVTRDRRRLADGRVLDEHIVRVLFHCNQACGFCFVSTHLPPPGDDAVSAAIDAIAALGGVLTLSGGEPTLHPRLVEYVRRGRAGGAAHIELQTNAIRLADGDLAARLAGAGLDCAFVSLHGATGETSDAITAAPGTFERTVAGIDALARTSVALRLNFVFCERNRSEFPAYVDLVAARWPRATVTVSFVAASTDLVPRTRALVPRYSDVMAPLAEGIRRARAAGLELTGYESMCGLPLCLVPDDISRCFALAPIAPDSDGGELIHPAECGGCALGTRCHGVRRGYVALHGTSELRAVGRRES